MGRLRLALDMDSVLADMIPVSFQIIEEWTGVRIGKLQQDEWLGEWYFLKKVGLEDKFRYEDLFQETWKRWYQIGPTERHIGGKVGELLLEADIDIVTASGGTNSDENRRKWLAMYHIPFMNFLAVPYGNSKSSLPYDIFIDDSPHVAEDCSKEGKKVLLYTQPYNLKVPTSDYVERIFSLGHARDYLQGRSKFLSSIGT